jgi:hypothetical protein
MPSCRWVSEGTNAMNIDFDEESWHQYMVEIQRGAELWKKRWPNHCRHCGGWGGTSYPATGPSYSCGGEPGGFDLCEAEPFCSQNLCHRCGGYLDTPNEDVCETGPCRECGWNYDDGVPGI